MLRRSITDALEHSAGKAQRVQNLSLSAFIASITTAMTVLMAALILFVLMKDRCAQVYQPRSSIATKRLIPNLPAGPISWLKPILTVPDEAVRHDCGFDAYLFLRYIKFLLVLIAPLALVSLPILLSMNMVGGEGIKGGISGLDQLSWSNVGLQQASHLWGHFGCAVVTVTWACFLITRELTVFAKIREAYVLADRAYMVLLTDVPCDLLSRERLAHFYDGFRSTLCSIQIHQDFTKLASLVCKRDYLQSRLEKAHTRRIESCVRAYGKRKDLQHHEKVLDTLGDREIMRLPICKWVPAIPFIGPKVDKLSHLEREVVHMNRRIVTIQQTLEDAPETTSAILQFTNELTARLVSRSVNLPVPHRMQSHYIDSIPSNILWKNFRLGWWNRRIREGLTSLIAILALFGWTVPMAFAGLLSQLQYLAQLFPWLRGLDRLPMWVAGMIQGVLPQVTTAVLILVFSLFLRFLVERQGHYDKVRIELTVQGWYFAFLFLHLFLTVSIASGLAPVLVELMANPRSASTILAQNLPKASNYFVSYVPLQAFTTAGVVLTQAINLTRMVVLAKYDHTPREKALRKLTLPDVQWGTFFPTHTNLACIVLIYSVIAPIILPLACVAFAVLWVVHRYSILYVMSGNVNTGGMLYPRALFQLLTGVYVLELCSIGLFALSRDTDGQPTSLLQSALMTVVLVLTVLYHWQLSKVMGPLLEEVAISTLKRKSKGAAEGLGRNSPLRNPALELAIPTIWIPNDAIGRDQKVGLSDREIERTRKVYRGMLPMSNAHACFDEQACLRVDHLDLPEELGVAVEPETRI